MASKLVFAAIHLGTVCAQQFLGGNFDHHVLAPDFASQVGQQFLGALGTTASKMVPPASSFASKAISENPDDSELQGVEDNLSVLVQKGDTPANRLAIKSMTDFLVKTLIPNRERQLMADQAMLDDQMGDIKECSLERARKADMHLDERLDTAEQHQVDYAKGKKEVAECTVVQDTRELIKDAHCISLDDAEKKCACHEDIKSVMGPLCKPGTVITPAYKKCCDKYAVYKAHQLKCQNTRHNTEHARLQGNIIADRVCAQYSSCYDKQVKEYKYVEDVVKGNEKNRNLKKLYAIKCLVSAFDTGKVTEAEVKACKEKKVDVKTCKFHSIPSKDACKLAPAK